MQNISGAELPSSVTTAQSLQYYAFLNKQAKSTKIIYKIHGCEKLNIILFGYLS